MKFIFSKFSCWGEHITEHTRCILYKKLLLIFFKIYRKHLCRSLFFNKVIGPEAYNLVKKETPTQVFPYIFSLIRDSDESISYLVQNRSIIFLTMGQIRSLRLSDTLKLNLKQKTTQGNTFIKDFFLKFFRFENLCVRVYG